MGIKIGNIDISSLYLGNTPITSVYLGQDKIYPDIPPTPENSSLTFTVTKANGLCDLAFVSGGTLLQIDKKFTVRKKPIRFGLYSQLVGELGNFSFQKAM